MADQLMEAKECILRADLPVHYRWSGRFVGKDGTWTHMERQLVDYELIVMEKGTLYLQDELGQYEVKEGEYLLMEPARMQRGWKPSKCRFYWMHFFPEPFSETAAKKGAGTIGIPRQGQLTSPGRMFILMKQLQDSDLRYMDRELNSYLATAVLFELKNQLQAGLPDPGSAFRKQVEDYVTGHLSESFSVAEMARHFGYHEKYFSALFKKCMGQSVKRYVDEKKTERAKYLLLNTDAWVSEIAEHLGYGNIQNFYHVFKKETDCTPSEYRMLYNKKQDNDV